MKPLFCRVGNKYLIKDKLLKYIPKHKIYVEAFVGSGAILFNKEKSEIEVINDLDNILTEGYELLKIVSDDVNEYNIQSGKTNIQKFVDANEITNENRLLQIIYKLCNTFSGKGFGKIYKDLSQQTKIKKIGEYKDRIKDVKIHNHDYKIIINKYDSPDTFFFLDPPYQSTKDLYKNEKFDYEELANILKNIKGYFMLTLNDSDYIREIFESFIIKDIIVKTHSGGCPFGKNERREIIVMNYEL